MGCWKGSWSSNFWSIPCVRSPIWILSICFSLTFVAMSPMPAFFALAFVGLNTGAIQTTAGFTDSCKKAREHIWPLDISSRDRGCVFAFPAVPHNGLVLAQAGALPVNLCLCTECVQIPKTVHTPFTCEVWLSLWLREADWTEELSVHQKQPEKEGRPQHPSHKVLPLDSNIAMYNRIIE